MLNETGEQGRQRRPIMRLRGHCRVAGLTVDNALGALANDARPDAQRRTRVIKTSKSHKQVSASHHSLPRRSYRGFNSHDINVSGQVHYMELRDRCVRRQ